MASGSRFCDLFDRVELLLLHSEAKRPGLRFSLVSYMPLARLFFFGQIDILLLSAALVALVRRKSCRETYF